MNFILMFSLHVRPCWNNVIKCLQTQWVDEEVFPNKRVSAALMDENDVQRAASSKTVTFCASI